MMQELYKILVFLQLTKDFHTLPEKLHDII